MSNETQKPATLGTAQPSPAQQNLGDRKPGSNKLGSHQK
jgi:hypothetical protein